VAAPNTLLGSCWCQRTRHLCKAPLTFLERCPVSPISRFPCLLSLGMSPIHALLLSGSLRVYSRSPSPAVLRPSCSPEPDQCPVFVPVRRCTPLFLPRPHFHLNFTSLFFLPVPFAPFHGLPPRANMPCSFGHPWPPLPSPTDLAGLGRLYQQMDVDVQGDCDRASFTCRLRFVGTVCGQLVAPELPSSPQLWRCHG